MLAPTGRLFDESAIGMALATRNLMDDLRSAGQITGGPRPFTGKDRSAFLSALDLAVGRAEVVDLRPTHARQLSRPAQHELLEA